ncbi:hypothetical protein LZ31DRAFT_283371 [Colletotrichum somersetense]|nr:hypothetical protein LZ31DRAFT_283371 [Colletotrichum somersetense]
MFTLPGLFQALFVTKRFLCKCTSPFLQTIFHLHAFFWKLSPPPSSITPSSTTIKIVHSMTIRVRYLRIAQLSTHLITGFLIALLAGWAAKTNVLGHDGSSSIGFSPYGDPAWVKAKALTHQYPCGQNRDMALSKGCVFEMATGTWQLPSCTHQQQNNHFSQLRNWEFFVYENRTLGETHPQTNIGIHSRRNLRAVSPDELQYLGPNIQVWTTWEFHLYRCAWLWKRDVLVANGNITGPIGGRQHCVDEALMKEDRFALGDVVAGYRVRFLSCSAPPSFIV